MYSRLALNSYPTDARITGVYYHPPAKNPFLSVILLQKHVQGVRSIKHILVHSVKEYLLCRDGVPVFDTVQTCVKDLIVLLWTGKRK